MKSTKIFVLCLIFSSIIIIPLQLTAVNDDVQTTYGYLPMFFDNGMEVVIFGGRVNVRNGSGTTNEVIFQLNEGDRVTIVNRAADSEEIINNRNAHWYEIQDSNERTGFVFGAFLTHHFYKFQANEKEVMILAGWGERADMEIRVLVDKTLSDTYTFDYFNGSSFADDIYTGVANIVQFAPDFFGEGMPAILVFCGYEACGYPQEYTLMGYRDGNIELLLEKVGGMDAPYFSSLQFEFIYVHHNASQNFIICIQSNGDYDRDPIIHFQLMQFYQLQNYELIVIDEKLLIDEIYD